MLCYLCLISFNKIQRFVAEKHEETEKTTPKKEEPSSMFQRKRVDDLLADLAVKFPPRFFTAPAVDTAAAAKPGRETCQFLERKRSS